jgi:hypothetical protein
MVSVKCGSDSWPPRLDGLKPGLCVFASHSARGTRASAKPVCVEVALSPVEVTLSPVEVALSPVEVTLSPVEPSPPTPRPVEPAWNLGGGAVEPAWNPRGGS